MKMSKRIKVGLELLIMLVIIVIAFGVFYYDIEERKLDSEEEVKIAYRQVTFAYDELIEVEKINLDNCLFISETGENMTENFIPYSVYWDIREEYPTANIKEYLRDTYYCEKTFCITKENEECKIYER